MLIISLNLLLVSALAGEILYVLFSLVRPALWQLGFWVQPLVVMMILGGCFWGGPHIPVPQHSLLSAHLLAVLVAHWLFLFAVFSGVSVWLREWGLKRHRLMKFISVLPAMEEAEKGQFYALWAAQASLLVALVAGAYYQWQTVGQWFLPNTKNILTYCIFIMGGFLLWAHYRFGTRGRQAAQVVLLVYFLFLLVYLTAK